MIAWPLKCSLTQQLHQESTGPGENPLHHSLGHVMMPAMARYVARSRQASEQVMIYKLSSGRWMITCSISRLKHNATASQLPLASEVKV
jgi:hypothetical protein